MVINVNNTVRWYNSDTLPIFIESDLEFFYIDKLLPGKSKEITFVKPGIYDYHGHPWMNGKVIVLES